MSTNGLVNSQRLMSCEYASFHFCSNLYSTYVDIEVASMYTYVAETLYM